jgi:hypothetical protein
MGTSFIAHRSANGNRLSAVLSLSSLRTLDHGKIAALQTLNLTTLSDLLHWDPVHRARIVVAAARDELAHDLDLKNFVRDGAAAQDPVTLAGGSTDLIDGVGPASADLLAQKFGVRSVAELAEFPPYVEAEALMRSEAEPFAEPASAPDELIPRTLGAIASTSRYSSFVIDRDVPVGGLVLEGGDKTAPEVLVLRAGFQTGKVSLGYAALHVQRWVHMGLHLGEVIHSLALAPGESRNIAIVDWKRSLLAGRRENSDALEWLQSQIIQTRALDAVTAGTAQEQQWGRTTALAANAITGLGIVGGSALAAGAAASVAGTATGAGGGALIGAAIGSLFAGFGAGPGALVGLGVGSFVGSVAAGLGTTALVGGALGIGYIRSESHGQRAVAAEERQNIMEVTAQKSSAARSLRSAIVVDDYQAGTTTARTFNVTNYNHAHALNVTYYELLNKYVVTLRTERVEPFLVLPLAAITFDIQIILRFWDILKHGIVDQQLVQRVDQVMGSSHALNNDGPPILDDPQALLNDGMEISVETRPMPPPGGSMPPGPPPPNPNEVLLVHEPGGEGGRALARLSDEVLPGGMLRRFTYRLSGDLKIREVKKIRIKLPPNHTGGSYRVVLKRAVVHGSNPSRDLTLENLDFGEVHVPARVTPIPVVRIGDPPPPPPPDQEIDVDFPLSNRLAQIEGDARGGADLVGSLVATVQARKHFFTRLLIGGLEREQLVDVITSLRVTGPSWSVPLSDLVDPEPIGITTRGLLLRLKVALNTRFPSPLDGIASYPAEIETWLTGDPMKLGSGEKDRVVTDQIYLPGSGVFAEAVLGRSNAAEKIDLTRFWNWQDSPIPNLAPSVAPVSTDVQASPTPTMSPTVPNNVLNLITPASFPAPNGLSGVLGALQNGSMFRDMSKSEQLVTLSTTLANAAQAIANSAGTLAGTAATEAMKTSAKMGETAANLASKSLDALDSPEAAPPQGETPTERGGQMERQDRQAKSESSPGTKKTPTRPAPSPTTAVPVAKPGEVQIMFRVRDIWGKQADADIRCTLVDDATGLQDGFTTGIRRGANFSSSATMGILPPLQGLTKGVLDLQVEMRSAFYDNMSSQWVDLEANGVNYEFPPGTRFATFYADHGFEEVDVAVETGETLMSKAQTALSGKVTGQIALKEIIKASIEKLLEVGEEGTLTVGGELAGSRNWEDAANKTHTTTHQYKLRLPTRELKARQVTPKIGP